MHCAVMEETDKLLKIKSDLVGEIIEGVGQQGISWDLSNKITKNGEGKQGVFIFGKQTYYKHRKETDKKDKVIWKIEINNSLNNDGKHIWLGIANNNPIFKRKIDNINPPLYEFKNKSMLNV